MNINLPRLATDDIHSVLRQEWLVTNGTGGFAAGTVAGALTRRYHGLLFAALGSSLERTLLAAKLDETALVGAQDYQLYTNVWASHIERPSAGSRLQRFSLIAGVPTWKFTLGQAKLIKRIWMEYGSNTTFIHYELAPGSPALTLRCRLLANHRHYHLLHREQGEAFSVTATDETLVVRANDGPVPLRASWETHTGNHPTWHSDHTWCHDFHLPVEKDRGFEHLEDHLSVGLCHVHLEPGASATLALSAGSERDPDSARALERVQQRAGQLLDTWAECVADDSHTTSAPICQLVLAADQFVVTLPESNPPDAHTIVAGYPWFTVRVRDTMIALPGLTLETGRADVARRILRAWAQHVDRGLIPNRLPDCGGQPDYNSADASLWYLWATDQYVRATGDVATLAELYPVMREIIDWYRRGTRHNIHVSNDGLVYAGDSDSSLTWMDARAGPRAITPRIGKPIELSALWYDALCNMARLANALDQPDAEYMRLAERTQGSFERFWNHQRGGCFDVLDGPSGNDGRRRPNQILAIALTHSPLSHERQVAVVSTCEHHLLTKFGLRSLAPGEPDYHSHYVGDQASHEGTVWGWLLGPLAIAHYRLYHDPRAARRLLEPLLNQIWTYGVGSLGETFDGDAPHEPRGCLAQAWTVAETLRAWHHTQKRLQAVPRQARAANAQCGRIRHCHAHCRPTPAPRSPQRALLR